MEISRELLAFLKDWYQWAQGNHAEEYKYYKDDGLCNNADCFADEVLAREIRGQLMDHFSLQGLDLSFPFGESQYDTDAQEYTQHLCPNRLAWVREMIEKGDAQ